MEKNTSQPASAASPFNWFEALRPTRINPGPLAAIWLKDNGKQYRKGTFLFSFAKPLKG